MIQTTPVSGGMGMHLLQKMGWKPGEGLGKEKNGSLQPLLLEVKLDKKGLVAEEEVKLTDLNTLYVKHPRPFFFHIESSSAKSTSGKEGQTNFITNGKTKF